MIRKSRRAHTDSFNDNIKEERKNQAHNLDKAPVSLTGISHEFFLDSEKHRHPHTVKDIEQSNYKNLSVSKIIDGNYLSPKRRIPRFKTLAEIFRYSYGTWHYCIFDTCTLPIFSGMRRCLSRYCYNSPQKIKEISGNYGKVIVGEMVQREQSSLLKKDGNFGIGTSSPGMLLTVAGNANISGTLYKDTTTYKNPDIAEKMSAKEQLDFGDVVSADKQNPLYVKKSVASYDRAVIGVVNANAETTSNEEGYAMKCDDLDKCRGAIVGKALQPLTQDKGKIWMLLSLQ